MDAYRIVLADDHEMVRMGFKKIINESKKPDLKIVGEASDGIELLDMLKTKAVDMVLLDISMPNMRGIEASYEIKRFYPQMKILILSMHKNVDFLNHALSAGADGYLLKEDSASELFSAIDKIRNGEIYVSSLLTNILNDDFRDDAQGNLSGSEEILTTREIEILKMIAEGKLSKEIGDLLFISKNTVQNHRASIMQKLNLNKIADLTKYAICKGYTSKNL